MAYWLIKTEPGDWSWEDQLRDKVTYWDGVRNYQARNNMRAMALGDKCFFYHSVAEKRIVGVVRVVKLAYPDPSDSSGRFDMVDVEALCNMPNPVSLAEIKAVEALGDMVLVKNSRLSVQPVSDEEWHIISAMGRLPA